MAEEFLSHYPSFLVNSNFLDPIVSPCGATAPSHILYANDVLLFCKETMQNLTIMT